MNELMEWLKSWQAVVAVLLGGPLTLLAGWWRFKERVWRLSEQRQRALRDLIKTPQWKKATALSLQLSLKQAYGKKIDERDFYFIMTRHNPMALLEHRYAAEDFARLNSNADGYEDARGWVIGWMSMKNLERILTVTASVLFTPLLIFVAVALGSNAVAGTLALLESIALVWVLIYAANKARNAHELLFCLDEKFPQAPDASVPSVLLAPESQTGNGQTKPPRSRSRRPKPEANGHATSSSGE